MYPRRNNWIWIVVIVIIALALLLAAIFVWPIPQLRANLAAQPAPPVAAPATQQPAATPAAPQTSSYTLSGQSYSSPQGFEYGAVWTSDGRLWQPQLPAGNLRKAHTVGITIEEGSYAFDGVECSLYLDPTRNGKGSQNPITVSYGNDLHFSVKTSDGQAWALVDCRGNFSTGFQIRSLGPLP